MELKMVGAQDTKNLNISDSSDDEDDAEDTSSFFGRLVSQLSFDDVFGSLCLTTITGVTGYLLGDQKGCGKAGGAVGTTIGALCGTKISSMPYHAAGTSVLATAAYIVLIPGSKPMDKLTLAAIAACSALCYFNAHCDKSENASKTTNSNE